MRGFTKFFWILFAGAIIYNIYLLLHLYFLGEEVKELLGALNGTFSETTKNMSSEDIRIKLEGRLVHVNELETFNFVFICLNGIFSYIFISRNWLFLKNKLKNHSKIPFLKLPQEEQDKILLQVFCDQCGRKNDTTFKEEKKLLGTPYILVNCKKCNHEIKIKEKR